MVGGRGRECAQELGLAGVLVTELVQISLKSLNSQYKVSWLTEYRKLNIEKEGRSQE